MEDIFYKDISDLIYSYCLPVNEYDEVMNELLKGVPRCTLCDDIFGEGTAYMHYTMLNTFICGRYAFECNDCTTKYTDFHYSENQRIYQFMYYFLENKLSISCVKHLALYYDRPNFRCIKRINDENIIDLTKLKRTVIHDDEDEDNKAYIDFCRLIDNFIKKRKNNYLKL